VHHFKVNCSQRDARPRFGHEATGGQAAMAEQRNQNALPALPKDTDQPQARSTAVAVGWQRADPDCSFSFPAHAEQLQDGDGYRRPQARGALRVSPARVLSLLARPFSDLDALFDPLPQPIPAGRAWGGGQIGQRQPGIGVAVLLLRQRNAIEPRARANKGRAGTALLGVGLRDEAAPRVVPDAGHGAKGVAYIDAQQWMPTQPHDAPKQPAGIRSPMGQDRDKEAAWDNRSPLTQHAQSPSSPDMFLSCRQDGPGHGNSAAAIEHAQCQYDKALPQGGRVQGQHHQAPFPPTQYLRQQGGKTCLHHQRLTVGSSLSWGFMAEFPQLLARGIGVAVQPRGQRRADRALRCATHHNHPRAPQGRDPHLWLAQVRQMHGDSVRSSVYWVAGKHGLPQGTWSVW